MKTQKKKHRKLKIVLITIATILIVLAAGFLIYVSDYYRADDTAVSILTTDTSIETEGQYTIIPSKTPSDTAIIFYPGGKVESTAYLPILEKLSEQGINCILVKMPFNLAVFDINAADNAFAELPGVKNWYIAGHSLGGVMASNYAAKNQEKVQGLILLGAYVYGDYPATDAITIYGTFNSDLETNINYTDNIVKIEGGNHAQFGNYGKQKGDPDATISANQQQDIAVDAIIKFIDNKNN